MPYGGRDWRETYKSTTGREQNFIIFIFLRKLFTFSASGRGGEIFFQSGSQWFHSWHLHFTYWSVPGQGTEANTAPDVFSGVWLCNGKAAGTQQKHVCADLCRLRHWWLNVACGACGLWSTGTRKAAYECIPFMFFYLSHLLFPKGRV